MDLSKLSTEDLLAMKAKQYDKVSDEGLAALHAQNSPGQQMARQAIQEASAKSPEELPKNLQMAFSSGQGGAANAGGELMGMLGKGITKGGSALLQKAVGLRKFVPGLGETLADEGIMGTKSMMQNQIAKGLSSNGQNIGDLAKKVQQVSTQPIAEKLGEQAAKLMGPDGEVLPDNIQAYHKFVDAATQASQEGQVSGEVAAARRAQYGQIANKAGAYREMPSQALKSQLAGSQQAGYSEALKNASPELAEADKSYAALSKANKAINQPQTISNSGIASRLVPSLIGGAAGGAPGALAGAALSTPLAQSAIGRGLIGLGRGASSQPAQAIPAALMEFLGRKNKSTEDR